MAKRWQRLRRNLLVGTLGTLAALALLITISHPYDSIEKARESVLRQDLRVLRDAIDQYTLDKQKRPQSLQDLVSANYLKEIPKDPITGSSNTWQTVHEDTKRAVDPKAPDIDDIHSGSQKKARDGTAYSTW